MEHPEYQHIIEYGLGDIDLLSKSLLRDAADIPHAVCALSGRSLTVVFKDPCDPRLPAEVDDNGVFTVDISDESLRRAVDLVSKEPRYVFGDGTVLLGGLKLWDRLGYGFWEGDRRICETTITWCWNEGMEEWGACVQFLMSRGCPTFSTAREENPLRDRLANLRLIPVLLRPRWLKSKSLPAPLVELIKKMLTGFVRN